MFKYLSILLGIVAMLTIPVYAEMLPATLVKCHDGDTCRFEVGNKVINVRFAGVDTPELDQPYGKRAKAFLLDQLLGKKITLDCFGSALGNRTACDVYADGQDVQAILVKNGYALDYPKYSKRAFADVEIQAKANNLGMWSQSEWVSPYCWRWTGVDACNKNPAYQP